MVQWIDRDVVEIAVGVVGGGGGKWGQGSDHGNSFIFYKLGKNLTPKISLIGSFKGIKICSNR
ncbi:MAG TPA: hypothetical protein ENO29_03805 [Candidatus Aminicenantes bacterium]|nr:hypothetical protein [Candidatus Aminicenantes bacterium]